MPEPSRRAARWTLLGAAAAALAALRAVPAQSPNPDPHWGAHAFPDARTSLRFSLSANRFTQFNGEGDEYPSAIDYSTGFQIGTLSLTDRLAGHPRLTYTLSLGAGWSGDQPTRALQNDFLHTIKGIEPVPVGDVYSSFEMIGGASATWWTDPVPRVPVGEDGERWRFGFFAGAGASAGTLYQEVEGHTGVYLQTPRVDLGITRGALRLGAMARGSLHQPGAAFETVSDEALLTQFELTWVSDKLESQPWWLLGAPSLSLVASYDTGLFVDRYDGDPIGTTFVSVRAEWPNGLRIETWNDMFGDSDYGPTYGFMVGFDVTALFGITP
jgi:hypothetical protein